MDIKSILYHKPEAFVLVIILLGLKSVVKLAGVKSVGGLLIKYKIRNLHFGKHLEAPLQLPKSTYPESTHKTYDELMDIFSRDKTILGGNDLK